MIKIGCSGFPVGKRFYESKFKLAEVSEGAKKPPRPGTLAKWRERAAPGFEFIVCASSFIPTDQTLNQAHALEARIVLFSFRSAMGPQADNVGRLQKFFGGIHARGTAPFFLAWDPPAAWPRSLIESVSKSLRLVPATNPLNRRMESPAPFRYFRLGDSKRTKGVHRFSDAELRDIKLACDKPLSYVVFNNGPYAFGDALRFASLV